jgi:hypothetical protein
MPISGLCLKFQFYAEGSHTGFRINWQSLRYQSRINNGGFREFCSIYLKGQRHEIFDPRFSHQSSPPRPLISGLKPFRI